MTRKILSLPFFLLVLVVMLTVACGPAETPVVDEAASAEAQPTATTVIEEDMPDPTPEAEPTDEPTAEPDPTEGPTGVDNRSDRLRSITASWNTDWTISNIDFDDILSGGPPRDGIPSIDDPKFIDSAESDAWLADNEPVVALEINGDARAYPIQILTWHEIVNDTVGDLPVVVTFCPLCNSAIVFQAFVNGEPTEFGVSGLLRNSDLIMYDRQTESLWQQFTGEGIVGTQTGEQLPFVASSLISYANFKDAYPEGVVLSRDTGISRNYGTNPYVGYDSIGNDPFLYTGPEDGRLPAVARVVTVNLPEQGIDVAYPLTTLAESGVINDVQGEQALTVFHLPGTASALGASRIADAEDVGATGVFDPTVDWEVLTFSREGEFFIDAETGSKWNIVGKAVEGELAGQQLTQIVSADHFWFSWAAFRPDTIVYGQ